MFNGECLKISVLTNFDAIIDCIVTFFPVLRVQLWVFGLLDEHFTMELYPQPSVYYFLEVLWISPFCFFI